MLVNSQKQKQEAAEIAECKARAEERAARKRKISAKNAATDRRLRQRATRAEKIEYTMNKILDRIVKESRAGDLEDVDWEKQETIKLRKQQLTNIRELLTVYKMMRATWELVSDDEKKNDKQAGKTEANLKLISDAKKALKQVGIKEDL